MMAFEEQPTPEGKSRNGQSKISQDSVRPNSSQN